MLGVVLGVMVLTSVPMTAAGASKVSIKDINDVFVNAAELAIPAVVTIISERMIERRMPEGHRQFREFWGEQLPQRGTALGSGIIIDAAKGHIITNYHVIEDADEIMVRLDDRRELKATVIGSDPGTDIAVLQIEADNIVQLEPGDASTLRIGEWVLAIGSPFSQSLNHTVTAGIVSGKGRTDVVSRRRDRPYEDFIQTDAAINPGNSGGALVNLEGQLVGVNTAIATDGFSRSSAGVGFAVPINLVMRVVGDLIEHGEVTRGWLGVSIQDVQSNMVKALKLKDMNGALVSGVVEASPADDAGVEDTDVIVKVGSVAITDASHLRNVISSSRPGDKPKVTVIRKGKSKVLTVELGKLEPAEPIALRRGGNPAGDTTYGRLGLALADLQDNRAAQYNIDATSGVVVLGVDPDGNAARDGIRPGDIVDRVGDLEIEDMSDYEHVISGYESGDVVLLRIARGDGFRFVGLEIS